MSGEQGRDEVLLLTKAKIPSIYIRVTQKPQQGSAQKL